MRGDEDQPASAAAGSGTRVRPGPRHAAPRKSLLTKLQMPAGKAIALAAMPTAVLMGMGLTPRLASADELPKNPFSGTKCVEQPDEPSPSSTPSSTPGNGGKQDGQDRPETPKPSVTPTPGTSDSGTGTGDGKGDGNGSTTVPASPSTPSAPASPSTKPSSDPLDPLGLGDALGDLLGVNKKSTDAAPADTAPSATATPAPSATSQTPTTDTTDKPADTTVKDTTDKVKKALSEVTKAAGDATGKATQAPDSTPSPLVTSADGKTPFPCPTHDAQALADAAYQETPALLADDPWTLHSSLLTLTGLDYKGIVEVKTWSGKVKPVLKFTASTLDIKDLHQEVVGPNGTVGHVEARKGSTSTIRGGTVTMYTESLKGNLFGLIPIEFTPDTPPPVNVPIAFFTNVTVKQAGQFGGTLKVPGMHVYNTQD
ncbi:hydrogenase expression protein HypF [Streptomyces sp. MI02-7b]|uniref:hydrogenase expression protein HypF n=1 Tax=Streptomyces sp. MI02-7b TaxID=462941 RepID=UPI0029B53ACE|nr:hydrogenase expression protein HypF [Streptomyces sp. MI02-7b]MDX3073176.1 hydrogenase expression protein HypF [Streptomyces sp. MI02-7b]